jgi:hypothetical protein
MASIPLPVIVGCYRVTLEYAGFGQHPVNVIHVSTSASGISAGVVNTAIQAAWQTQQLQHLASGGQLTNISIIPLDGISGASTFTTPGTGKWAGTATGDSVPSTAIIIKLGTGLRGRDNRGRIFLPMPAESQIANGAVVGSVASALGSAWFAFQSALQTGTPTMSLGVASYDRAHAGAGAHFSVATSISCEGLVGTQRRRQQALR